MRNGSWKVDAYFSRFLKAAPALMRRLLIFVVSMPRVDCYNSLNGRRFTAEEKIPVFTTPVITVE